MAKLTKKQNRIAVSIWVFIGLIIILSNNIIEFLSIFGVESSTANILIVFAMVLLAYYHVNIAKELSGII